MVKDEQFPAKLAAPPMNTTPAKHKNLPSDSLFNERPCYFAPPLPENLYCDNMRDSRVSSCQDFLLPNFYGAIALLR